MLGDIDPPSLVEGWGLVSQTLSFFGIKHVHRAALTVHKNAYVSIWKSSVRSAQVAVMFLD